MRRLPLLLAALTLQACIGVEDFGDSWAKGTSDPALAGRWKKIGLPGEAVKSAPRPEMAIFTRTGDGYDVTNGVDRSSDKATLVARTLRAGTGRLLMLRAIPTAQDGRPATEQGMLFRYEVTDDLLREFRPDMERVGELLKSKYSAASGVGLNHGLTIERVDEDTSRLLSEVASDSSYWILTCEYRKQP